MELDPGTIDVRDSQAVRLSGGQELFGCDVLHPPPDTTDEEEPAERETRQPVPDSPGAIDEHQGLERLKGARLHTKEPNDMLCANSYTKRYVDDCRSRIAAQVAAYRALVAAAKPRASADEQLLKAALEAFEPHFFNSMVLALDSHFVHRARAMEKKDGNPLNEVRMLSNSIMNNGSVMCADKTIKYNPATSVLKRRVGDKITLNEADFTRLSSAYLAEIEAKYL